MLRTRQSIETESILWLPEAEEWSGVEWKVTANGYRASLWDGENILESESADGCTTL